MTGTVSFVSTGAQMAAALHIRRRVFIEEQGVPEDIEVDAYDAAAAWNKTAVHALLEVDGNPVATGRLLLGDGPAHNAHIGRVAVLPQFRRRGLGRRLMLALQDKARELGYPGITLAAQLQAIPFYERLGYTPRGPVFLDAGIEHRWMDLAL
jgi:predicted GNAT family N-acyltransferase